MPPDPPKTWGDWIGDACALLAAIWLVLWLAWPVLIRMAFLWMLLAQVLYEQVWKPLW